MYIFQRYEYSQKTLIKLAKMLRNRDKKKILCLWSFTGKILLGLFNSLQNPVIFFLLFLFIIKGVKILFFPFCIHQRRWNSFFRSKAHDWFCSSFYFILNCRLRKVTIILFILQTFFPFPYVCLVVRLIVNLFVCWIVALFDKYFPGQFFYFWWRGKLV